MKNFIGNVKYVFLPGVPGRKKDFQFIKDLRNHGLSIIEYRHPGLYEEDGYFSVVDTVDKITSLLKSFEKSRTPFVIIAYSFSSLVIQKINIKKFNYLRGVIMFSPICGLGNDWVMEDFNEDLKRLISAGECRPCSNLGLEINRLKEPVYGFDAFKKLTDSGVPISLCFSKNDTVINIEKLKKSVTEFRDLFGQGALLAIEVRGGNHRIDSYYNECIRNLLLSFVAREKVHNLIGNNCQVFLWGSTQITNFFKRFLIKAKKNTYTLSGERGENILADGAKEFSYKFENFYYRDRYYGSDPFAGEEMVFLNNKSFWVMNYSGRCLKSVISKSEIYNFLKKCLRKVSTDNPFRGPSEYQSGAYIYKNKMKGNIDNFCGEEFIYYKNKRIYELRYHGGLIK